MSRLNILWSFIVPLSFSHAGDCPEAVKELFKKQVAVAVSCVASGAYVLVLSRFPDSVENDLAGVSYHVLDSRLVEKGLQKAALKTESGLGEEVVALRCDQNTKLSCDFSADAAERMIFQVFVPPRAGHIYSLRLSKDGKLSNEIAEGHWFSDPSAKNVVKATEANIIQLAPTSEGKKLPPEKFIYKDGEWKSN